MAKYPKTTGECVTVRPKKSTATNGGRMLLDDALMEMLDMMLPVGELKTFATDQVSAFKTKMAEYGQEWVEPDGRLLAKASYPDLFNLIGYNYGWSTSNPNGTYTHSFTDVDGVAKSLVIYNDLDIDGNAKPVSGTPAYFRIPNFAGRFLRCAGTASYVNKWTDTDGAEHQILTEYSAEMYKGKLDAIRNIKGILNYICSSKKDNITLGGNMCKWQKSSSSIGYISLDYSGGYNFDPIFSSEYIVPIDQENNPIENNIYFLVRTI